MYINIGNNVKKLWIVWNFLFNELVKFFGVFKVMLFMFELGGFNFCVDILDFIVSVLRFILGDLFGNNNECYFYIEKNFDYKGDYFQVMKFCIGQGNIIEIWYL